MRISLGLGQRVVARDREVERVVHQVVEDDLAGDLADAVGVGDDRDVEVAGGEPRDELGRHRLVEAQVDLGELGVERADGERDERRVGGRGRADVEAAALERAERVELALGRGQAVEDRVGVADQQLAGLGQPHAAGGALDQARAGLGLERGDLARHGGLGEGERLGRGGEGAVRGDLAQDPQASDVKHVQSVYQSGTKIICVYTSGQSRMLPMHPHTALSLALITEFDRERTQTVRRPSPRSRGLRLRAARSRRAARAIPAGCS